MMPENPSHEVDMVSFYSSSNTTAEFEANAIHAILEASGIPSIVIGATAIPSLEFVVQVPKDRLSEAEQVVAEAREAGSRAAVEAELATEGQDPDQIAEDRLAAAEEDEEDTDPDEAA